VVTTSKVTTKVTKVTVGKTKPATDPFLRCPRDAPNNCRTNRRLMRIGLPILFNHFLNLAINSAKKRLILRLCLESDILFYQPDCNILPKQDAKVAKILIFRSKFRVIALPPASYQEPYVILLSSRKNKYSFYFYVVAG
jgi:hypothetical protein